MRCYAHFRHWYRHHCSNASPFRLPRSGTTPDGIILYTWMFVLTVAAVLNAQHCHCTAMIEPASSSWRLCHCCCCCCCWVMVVFLLVVDALDAMLPAVCDGACGGDCDGMAGSIMPPVPVVSPRRLCWLCAETFRAAQSLTGVGNMSQLHRTLEQRTPCMSS